MNADTHAKNAPVLTIRVTRNGVSGRFHKGIDALTDVDWENVFDRVDGYLEDVLFRILSADDPQASEV